MEASIKNTIGYFDDEIERTEKLIKDHIGSHPRLKADRGLLLSIPGKGLATTARLLAEINFHQHESARSVAAFTGLVPRLRQSGTSLKGKARSSKLGSPRVRHALYFPAATAIRCNPTIKAWATELRGRGKCDTADHRGRDEEADSSRLRRAQDG